MLLAKGINREMVLLKRIRYQNFPCLLNRQPNTLKNPHLLASSILSNSIEYSFLSSIFRRNFSLSVQFLDECVQKSQKCAEKPLSVVFKEAVGISEKVKHSGSKVEGGDENSELKKKLRNLAEEIGSLKKASHEVETPNSERPRGKIAKKGNLRLCSLFSDQNDKEGIQLVRPIDEKIVETKPKKRIGVGNEDPLLNPFNLLIEEVSSLKKRNEKEGRSGVHAEKPEIRKKDNGSLWALFRNGVVKEEAKLLKHTDFGQEKTVVHKELSPEMQAFAELFYMEGYLNEKFFRKSIVFDLSIFLSSYAREYLKFAAFEFGKDKAEIAKWLSASDLKKVALFGCPSVGRKSVHAAKNIRKFFKIEEQMVCQTCALKESCKFANKQYEKDVPKLYLGFVNRVLVSYALESVPENLVVPEEIKSCVSRLLKEIVSLSQETPSSVSPEPFQASR